MKCTAPASTLRGTAPKVEFDAAEAEAAATAARSAQEALTALADVETRAAAACTADWTGRHAGSFNLGRLDLLTKFRTCADSLEALVADLEALVADLGTKHDEANRLQDTWNASFLAWSTGCDQAEAAAAPCPPTPTYSYS